MGLYDIIDEITERQVMKTETGDNRIWGVMVGIVAKNFDPNSSASGGTKTGADAMDGRVCVTIPTRDKDANELKWARVAMPSGGSKWGHYFLPEVGDQVQLLYLLRETLEQIMLVLHIQEIFIQTYWLLAV